MKPLIMGFHETLSISLIFAQNAIGMLYLGRKLTLKWQEKKVATNYAATARYIFEHMIRLLKKD